MSLIEQQIKAKIEAVGTPLKDWDINIYRGILTGYNEAFIINGKKKDELIAEDPKSAEIIRPILRGRDIRRYGYEFADLWLLFVPWHFPLHEDSTIQGASQKAEEAFKIQYPAVYSHLLSYKAELSNRNKTETGIRYEWYALQRWGANYWEDFYKQKIVYPGLMRIAKSNSTNFPRFALDLNQNYFFGNDCYFIAGEHIEYLWLILNSTLIGYLFRYYIYSFDETGFKIFSEYFQNIPIPKPNKKMLDYVKKFGGEEVRVHEINKWVYSLYDFTPDEILEIENAVDTILNVNGRIPTP